MATTAKIGFNNPSDYLDEVVLPAYRNFTQLPRRANAMEFAIAAWHMEDQLWLHLGKPFRDKFRANLVAACPELRLVRDLCDAAKHHELDRKSVTLVALEGAEGGGMFEMSGPLGTTSRFDRGSLELVEANGSRHDVYPVFRSVAEFWRSEIEKSRAAPLPSP
jgi:hypothetical protein